MVAEVDDGVNLGIERVKDCRGALSRCRMGLF
jgi:hypothetical protein